MEISGSICSKKRCSTGWCLLANLARRPLRDFEGIFFIFFHIFFPSAHGFRQPPSLGEKNTLYKNLGKT